MTDREKSECAEWDFRVAQLALLTALAQKLTGRKVTVFLDNAPASSTHGGAAGRPGGVRLPLPVTPTVPN